MHGGEMLLAEEIGKTKAQGGSVKPHMLNPVR